MKPLRSGMLPQKRLQDDFNRARKAVNDNPSPHDDELPRWDLESLYKSPDAPELKVELEQIDKLCDDFVETYEGTLEWLSGGDLGKALRVYEQIEALRHKVSCYITLMESDDVANFARLGDLNKWFQENGGKIGFFEAELAAMKEQTLMPKLAAPELAAYAPWLAVLRARDGQSLPDGLGGLSADFATTSREGWNRFYHETINVLRVDWQGEKLSLDDMADRLSSMTLAERQEGRRAMADALRAQSARIALCYNAMIRDDMIDNDLSGVTRPDAPVNRANRAGNEVVDTMFDTIKSSYAQLSHRFYEWKAQQHGQEVMPRAQVGMKLPGLEEASHEYSFGEAKRLVMRAFRKFSPKFARLAEKVFSAGHIDAEPREGKDTGAFALPTGPGNVPYVMLSFTGTAGDVAATLGHELGHAVHQQLAEKACGFFMSDVPTPVAETASIFAEMLVFEELLKTEKDEAVRKKLLVDRLENMLGNGLQQLAYYDFEKRVHEARREGELDAEAISDIWVETQREYYGPSVETDDYDRYYWMTVPHFFDTPFYVYSYAFAQQVVSGLYRSYKTAEAEGPEARAEFIENYIGLLESGLTKNLYEMFQPFDLDPESKEFWENGLSLAAQYMDDLAALDTRAPAARADKPSKKQKGPGAGKK